MKHILVDVKLVEGTGWIHTEHDNDHDAFELISLLLKSSKYPIKIIMETRVGEEVE